MNSKESLIYTEYKTISMLPEQILEAYHDKMTIEKIEILYEKVKCLISEIPEEEAQNYLEQMGQYLHAILDGNWQIVEHMNKNKKWKEIELDEQDGAIYENKGLVCMHMEDYNQAAVYFEKAFLLWKKGDYSKGNSSYLFANYAIALQKTGNYELAFEMFKMARDAQYPLYDALVETHGIGKEIYESRIGELMNQVYRTCSEHYKIEINMLKKVRKIFNIPESEKLIGFFDYTLFGSAREGIAVTSEGLYFKTLMPKIVSIKWYELYQYDMDYKNCIQLKLKKGSTNTIEMCFQVLLDATKFLEVMKTMQNL